ncbi:MAG: hypothetical protein R3A48_12140 [Polyangiales bacterium]
MRRALLALILLGCGPSTPSTGDAGGDIAPPDAACSPSGATIELGGGTGPTLAGYRPLSNGDTVYLTPGPQGGQHIWIGLRATGIDPSQPLVTLRAYRDDGALIGQIRVRLRFSPLQEDPSRYGLPALTLIIDDDRYCSVLAASVRVTAEVNDGSGRCLNVERTLRVDGIDPAALEIDQRARLACCEQFLRRCYPAGPPADASVAADAGGDAGDDG